MVLSEVGICNMALAHLGVDRTLTDPGTGLIADVTDNNAHSRSAQLFYEKCRDLVLTDYPWPFATKYVELVLLNDGDDEVWSGEWGNAYSKPADCLIVRRFLTNALTADTSWWQLQVPHDYVSPPFEIKQIDGVEAILTDVSEDMAFIEYTALIDDATLYPIRFGFALSRRLAFDMGTHLRVNAELLQTNLRIYAAELDAAKRSYGNESDPRADSDGDFIRSRSC